MTIIYDEFLNPVEHPDIIPGDDTTDNDLRGMAAVLSPSPVLALNTETVPHNLERRLSGNLTIKTVGNEEVVSANGNAMMVNTVVTSNDDIVLGEPDNYDDNDNDEEQTTDKVVGELLDPTDYVVMESLMTQFTAALESMGYQERPADQLDPNQPVDLQRLMDEVEYADDSALRVNQRVEYIADLKEEIIQLGGISRDHAMELENHQPKLVTAHAALESFTQFPSKTNYRVVVAAMEDLVTGAAVAGLTLAILAIVKLVKWILKKIEQLRYGSVSDADFGQWDVRYKQLERALQQTTSKFGHHLHANPNYQQNVVGAFSKLGITDPNVARNPARANAMYMDRMFEYLVQDKYNDITRGMYDGSTYKLAQLLGAGVNNGFVSLERNFQKIKAANGVVNPQEIVADWKELAPLAQALDVGMGKTPMETVVTMGQAVQNMTAPIKDPVPRYTQQGRNIKFRLDHTFEVQPAIKVKIGNMLSEIIRWEKALGNIPDPQVRDNRAVVLKIFQAELKAMAYLVNILVAVRQQVLQYVAYINQVVSRTERMWQEAFSIAKVHFDVK